MEGIIDPLTASAVQRYVDSTSCDNFGALLTAIQVRLGRQIPREEKGFISSALRCRRMKDAEVSRRTDSLFPAPLSVDNCEQVIGNILMVTAYSDDYTIGSLCEKVNRNYAVQHGYEFISEVLPLSIISSAISPKKHCAWYKIALLRKLFADVANLQAKGILYVMWIDADAIVVDHSIKLTDIISRCGGRDLIIAEDMNTGCLINSGVFMLRTTHWSRDLLDDVWNCEKYDDVTFYEQSAMIRTLQVKKEDLDSVSPFHSFLPNAAQGIKLFPHTAVLPLADFNSNKGILCNDVKAYNDMMSAGDAISGSPAGELSERCTAEDGSGTPARRSGTKKLDVPNHCYRASGNFCTLCQRTVGNNLKRAAGQAVDHSPSLFVFHPAGMPDKLTLLCAALLKYNVPWDFLGHGTQANPDSHAISSGGSAGQQSVGSVGGAIAPLRLVRGKLGQIPQADQHHLLSRMPKQA